MWSGESQRWINGAQILDNFSLEEILKYLDSRGYEVDPTPQRVIPSIVMITPSRVRFIYISLKVPIYIGASLLLVVTMPPFC